MIADECHWGITKGGGNDMIVNDRELCSKENFFILLVSATPQNLLTYNSRFLSCH